MTPNQKSKCNVFLFFLLFTSVLISKKTLATEIFKISNFKKSKLNFELATAYVNSNNIATNKPNSHITPEHKKLDHKKHSDLDMTMASSQSFTYNFTDLSSSESNWNFEAPGGNNLQNPNTARRWSWDNNDTTSSGVGPNIGQGDAGYVYTEMSTPGANGDVFTAELDANFDASSSNIIFSYYFGYRGDGNNGTIQLQSNENGAGWINRGSAETLDQQGLARNATFSWLQVSVNLTGLISGNSTRFRLVITQGSNGTSWHKDVGLDSVTVTLNPAGLDSDGDGIQDSVDLDDDNDGILDTEENECVFSTYNFTDLSSSESNWNFEAPGGNNLQNPNTARRWSWDNNDTTSSGVGPNIGQGDAGYVYTEMSSPGANGDVFTAELDANFDASSSDIIFSYYFGYRGDGNNGTIQLQSNENGAGWVNRGNTETLDQQGLAQDDSFSWLQISVDLSGLISGNSTRFRLVITQGSSGTAWHKDVGLDSVTVSLCSGDLDTDTDTIPNRLDLDSDNDGIPDNIEAQSTQGYIAPSGSGASITDTNSNGVNDNYEISGNIGLTPVNTDEFVSTGADTTPDFLDLDSDGDGTFDIVESGSSLTDGDLDGRTDGTVGTNGLDNSLDVSDDYADVNGSFDDTQTDNFTDTDNDSTTGGDVDYRDNVLDDNDLDDDGVDDATDVDDDNDGILDTDENCVIPGAASPELDQITYIENGFEIFAIGDNTDSGLGFQESGFEEAAFEKGLTLTRLNGSSDFSSLPAAPGVDGTAHTTTGTFTNGSLSYSTTAANPETRRNQFRQTTGSSFISGTSGDAIYVKPSIDLQIGEDYTVDIDFTTPVYAFNFDLVDILDTFNDDPGTVVKYEVYADSQLIAYFQSAFLGDDATGNVDVFDANDVSQGTMLVGQNVESSIGFLTSSPISNVSIVHSVVSGSIFNSRADLHSIDNFVWSTQPFSCFADDIDFDGDGLSNDRDIDSDNDGIPDNIEAQSTIEYIAPNYAYGANGLDTAYGAGLTAINTDNFGNADYVSLDSDGDGLFDTDEVNFSIDIDNDGMSDGTVGTNGLDNTLYATDDFLDINGNINDPRNLPDIDGDVLTIGDVDYRDTHLSGTPLITQVLQTDASKSIEVTNIHPTNTILANSIKFSLYSNKTGDQSNIIPDEVYIISSDILPGESVVITDLNIVDISNADDILLLTHPNGISTNETAYNNRYDTTESISDNTIYVRSDEISATSIDFNSSEWVAFVDDNLDPYADTPERHPHDPLLSEINTADPSSNLALGVHNTGVTTRSGSAWSNGIPDRTRRVVIGEDYEVSDIIKAKNLTINSNTKLTINNNFLVVTDDIVLTDNTSEIRLSGTSQLIQTHTTSSKVTGTGNLFIDQNSEIGSTYRYNYMSSPVAGNSFTLSNNLKDGSTPTSSTSAITDINFVSGLDGDTTTPISIASRWIYSFVSADNELSNWLYKGSDTSINATDGFTIKGPGSAQNYTFVGTPNDGTYTTAIGGYQSYLLGNPYPSAINTKKFIDDNIASISGTLYFWQHASEADTGSATAGHNYSGYIGGYSTRNISMGLAANSVSSNTEFDLGNDNDFYQSPAEYIAVGQGFFVIGTELGGNIEFNNAQREFITEGSQSIFFKRNKKQQKNNSLPIIKLGLDYNNEDGVIMHRQIGISFKEGNTNAFENGYDSYLFDQSFTDFYWKFPDSEDKLVIAGVGNNFNDLEIPLEVYTGSEGDIIIGIDEWNINNYNVFIYDKLLDVYNNITEEKTNLTLPSGLQEDRFFLTFLEKETLSNKENHLFTVNAFYNSKTERIQIDKNIESTIKNITLYNILGQTINEWKTISKNNSTKVELKTKADKNNIYILKFKIDNEEITKKLIIE